MVDLVTPRASSPLFLVVVKSQAIIQNYIYVYITKVIVTFVVVNTTLAIIIPFIVKFCFRLSLKDNTSF